MIPCEFESTWSAAHLCHKAGAEGDDTMLARQLTRHRSESSFARYSKWALEIQAQEQFYEAFGEAADRNSSD